MESHERGTSDWLVELRKRFVDVASRRVNHGDVEDVVQDAMRVVIEKRVDPTSWTGEAPPLAWCFQVLRNAIGNHYRREDTRQRRFVPTPDDADAPGAGATAPIILEALDSESTLRFIEDALAEMREHDPNCGRYLARLIESAAPRDIAREEQLDPAVFYRRLYRCRERLRELLGKRGISV